ncbi:MAG: B12-binding domain-containing radical SAM protein [Acidobacteria bacterium]|nr:B12-binding domain-containing radical SAM protein [Acidobacteriota bacterium]
MILLFHPRSTKPRSRRFPLSVLSLAAVLEGKQDYAIVDGNVEADPVNALLLALQSRPADLLAVSVMPGPQMVAAIEACRAVRQRFAQVPIVWGGYFPSLYPDAALNAGYVDFAARGQGEETLAELLEALRRSGGFAGIRGLSYKTADGSHKHNPERGLQGPDAFPWLPYHRLDTGKYILPTFLGKRTAVHQASIGCPYPCSFCGVISTYGSREKMEPPERTEAILRHLQTRYGVDSIQFYDNNFFLREDHARDLCDRIAPLRIKWWCEARIDIVLKYSDSTLRAIRDSGCAMIFFGAESGSDWVLEEMKKHLTTRQTLELAARIQEFGIIPEFSFVVGNPHDPSRDTRECLQFIRKIKTINPAAEIILQHYIPVPQRERMYGGIESQIVFPASPDEWATERWLDFTLRKSPGVSWLPAGVKDLIDNFELVVNSRWPTVQDIRLPAWGRALLQTLSSWRYQFEIYAHPFELSWAQRLIDLRKPKIESL